MTEEEKLKKVYEELYPYTTDDGFYVPDEHAWEFLDNWHPTK